jgi:hypothetical protein
VPAWNVFNVAEDITAALGNGAWVAGEAKTINFIFL